MPTAKAVSDVVLTLRDYQHDAVDGVRAAFGAGHRRTAVVMPTGTGKTAVAGEMARRTAERGGHTLFVTNREELVDQAARTFVDGFGLSTSIEMADRRGSVRDQVVVATIQSLQGARLERWPRAHPSLVVVDECHHAVAPSYLSLMEHFTGRVVGFTATPDRADDVGLGEVFGAIAYRMEMLDAIQGGWLVPVRSVRVKVAGLDLSRVKTRGKKTADFQDEALAKALRVEGVLQAMATPIVEQSGNRSTLVFCANVAHAHDMAAMINRHGAGMAVALDGSMDGDTRRDIISRFRAGRIRFLCSCALLLEGFDAPVASCVVMARMTRSRALYAQAVGRGTRLLGATYAESVANGKSDLLVLDLVGAVDDFSLVCPADVLEGKALSQEERKVYAKLAEGGESDVNDLLGQIDAALQAAQLVVGVKYDMIARDPFKALGLRRPREADDAPRLTEGQRNTRTLQSLGMDLNRMTRREAAAMIDEARRRFEKGLCSIPQARRLMEHGISPKGVAFGEAARLLDAIARNGWKVPGGLKQSVRRMEEV